MTDGSARALVRDSGCVAHGCLKSRVPGAPSALCNPYSVRSTGGGEAVENVGPDLETGAPVVSGAGHKALA